MKRADPGSLAIVSSFHSSSPQQPEKLECLFLSFNRNCLAKIGTFKIIESFSITDRGIVVVGHFIDGHARVGSTSIVEIKGTPANVKIIGIEWGRPGDDDIIGLGLLFSFENPDLENVAKSERIKQQTIEIAFDELPSIT